MIREIRRSDTVAALLVFLATIVLHASQLLGLRNLVGQFSKYPVAAARLHDGTMAPERLLDYSPAYLKVTAFISGHFQDPFRALIFLQLFLTAMACAGLFLLLRRHFGPALSLAGAAVYALNRSVTVYAYVFEPESLLLCLLIWAVYLSAARGAAAVFTAGTLTLLGLLTRPSFSMLVLLVPAGYLLCREESRRWRSTLWFLLPILAGIGFLTFGSTAYSGRSLTSLMNPGVVFFEGNNPLSSGSTAAYPPLVIDLSREFPGESDYHHSAYRLLARRSTGEDLSHGEVNAFWSSRALNYIGDHPLRFLTSLFRKAYYAFHRHRWHDLRIASRTDAILAERGLFSFPLALISAFGLAGVALGGWRRREYLLCAAVLLGQSGLMLLTYASARQRLPLLPFLIFFAAVAVVRLKEMKKGRLPALAVTVALGVLFSINTGAMRDSREVWANYGRMVELDGEMREARAALDYRTFRNAASRRLALGPWRSVHEERPAELPVGSGGLSAEALEEFEALRGNSPTDLLDRVLLLISAGRLAEAEERLRGLQKEGSSFDRILNRPPSPSYYLGEVAARRGLIEDAVSFTGEHLDEFPGDPAALARMVVLAESESRRLQLIRYFDELSASLFLGRAYLDGNRPDKAVGLFERLVSALPEYREGKIYLAASLGAEGRYEEAAQVYLEAMKVRVSPVMLQETIVPVFRKWAEASGPEDVASFWHGRVLRQYGEFEEARRVLEKSLEATGRDVVREELLALEELMRAASMP